MARKGPRSCNRDVLGHARANPGLFFQMDSGICSSKSRNRQCYRVSRWRLDMPLWSPINSCPSTRLRIIECTYSLWHTDLLCTKLWHSPASVLFYRELIFSCDLKFRCKPDKVLAEDEYVSNLRRKMANIHDPVCNNIDRASDRMKDQMTLPFKREDSKFASWPQRRSYRLDADSTVVPRFPDS